ncbi:MAG TPA: FG-GAP-like repeat-containing protein [Gemmatimonadaceae bacterium]
MFQLRSGVTTRRRWRLLPALLLSLGVAACNQDRVAAPSPVPAGAHGGPELLRATGARPAAALRGSGAIGTTPAPLRAAATTAIAADSYILWGNGSTGDWGFWGMAGTSYLGDWSSLYNGSIAAAWQVVATADFTHDGNTDLVWQNSVTGDIGIWPMSGTTWTGEHIPLAAVPTQWRIAAAADFTGDAKPDLVWQNTQTGERGLWVMNATTFTGEYILLYPELVPTQWEIVGAADMNGDHMADLVWQNTQTGDRGAWLMNHHTYASYASLYGASVPTNWDIAAVIDMTRDGKPDLVWQNTTTGERGLWVMDGTTFTGEYRPLYTENVATAWNIAAVIPAPVAGGTPASLRLMGQIVGAVPVEFADDSLLMVQVRDALGNPVPGTVVYFRALGGGSVDADSVIADADGIAAAPRWTTSITPTRNQLVAEVHAIPSVSATVTTQWRREFSAGATSACGYMYGPTLCWGNNANGQLGTFAEAYAATPTDIGFDYSVVESFASGAAQHNCVVKTGGATGMAGAVTCWGRGGFGQLGNDAAGDGTKNAPVDVATTVAFASVSVGRLSTCGVATNGDGYCWGANQHGALGTTLVDVDANALKPTPIDGGHSWKQVAAGWLHGCGITTDGDLYCWGDNTYGQLGNGSAGATPTRVPTKVNDEKWVDVAVGAWHTCGVTDWGGLYCWGSNESGQLGTGDTNPRSTPAYVNSTSAFTNVVTQSYYGDGLPAGVSAPATTANHGAASTCALAIDGTAYCWGWNGAGQVGDGSTTTRTTPVAVSTTLRFNALVMGDAFTCGIRGPAMHCWGANQLGQFGSGSTTPAMSSTPVAVGYPFNP